MTLIVKMLAAGALTFSGTAIAQVNEPAPMYKVAPEVKVLERNARGRAIAVQIGNQAYKVCMNDMQDNCIQPRAAGLNYGNRPLATWPGEPASSRG